MTETQERALKAIRRAWREFTDAVNKMGHCHLSASVDEREREGEFVVEVFGHIRVDE